MDMDLPISQAHFKCDLEMFYDFQAWGSKI